MKSSILFFCALFILPVALLGQVSFESLSGPTGGGIGDIAINSSGNIFIYVSPVSGNSKPVAGSVYRSTNNGTNWIKISNGTNGLADKDAYDILIDNLNNVYVLGKTRIYKSIDNGANWEAFTPPVPFEGGSGLAKTDDGDLFLYHRSAGIFRSVDDGRNWTNISNNLPSQNCSAIIGIGNDVYVGVQDYGTFRAVNPGTSPLWETINTGTVLANQPASFALKGTRLYQTNRNGAYYWNGSSWVQIAGNSPGPNFIPDDFNNADHAIVNGKNNRLYIFFNHGKVVYSDNDTAGPWTEISDLQMGDNVYALASLLDAVFVGYGRQGIMRSANNGTSWGPADQGLFFGYNSSFVQTNDGKLLIATGGPRLNVSDNGDTWTKPQVNPACNYCGFNTLKKLGNGDILAIGNETYRSVAADNGTNWTDIGGPPDYLHQAVSGNDTKFYGAKYNGSSTPPTYYISSNGAVSWSILSLSGLPTDYELRRMEADASSNLYLYLFNKTNSKHEIFKVNNTTTVANKVINIGLDNGMDNMRSLGSAIYVLGRTPSNVRQIAKSTDGGGTWNNIGVPSFNDFFVVTNDILIGNSRNDTGSTFMYSNDGGSTWKTAFTEGENANLTGAAIRANGIVHIALSQAPMYRSETSLVRPNAPTNLQVIATGENTVQLEWDHDGLHVTDFVLERRLQSELEFDSVGVTEGAFSRYILNGGLTKNTAYVYRVLASSDAGRRSSASVMVTTKDDCALTIPDNRSWTGTVAGGFINTNIGIRKINSDAYLITEVTAGSMQSVAKNGGGTYGETAVQTFFYENCGQPFIVPADDLFPNGNGSWNGTTLTLNFQIDKAAYTPTEKTISLVLNTVDPAPAPLGNAAGYVYDNTSIQLQWEAGLFHKKYIIHRSTNPAFTPSAGTLIATVDYPTTIYTDPGPFTAGTTYYYKIRAQNGNVTPLETAFSAAIGVPFNKPAFILSNTVVSNTSATAPSAAWADFDNDGFEDLLMTELNSNFTNVSEPLFFRNTGTDFELLPGKFPGTETYVNPSVGDYNNDGQTDVFLTALASDVKPEKYSLFKNEGNLTFAEQNNPVVSQTSPGGSFGSLWLDFNKDGKLDLFVSNQEEGTQALYQGDGTGGFTKITTGALATATEFTSSALWCDYNKDGFPDVVLVATEGANNLRLYKNNNGVFESVTGIGLDPEAGANLIGGSWGDYDNDLDMDLFLSNQEGKNFLYRNNGNGTFTRLAAVDNSPTEDVPTGSFGSAWGDIDNDGDLDLVVANAFGGANSLYLNQGSGTFSKVSGEMLTSTTGFHLSASFADYDKNGFLDVVVGELIFTEEDDDVPTPEEPKIKLYKNNHAPGNNWIQIKCIGTTSNRSAIGARIIVTTGTKTQMREITSHSGFVGQSSMIAHFGLGTSTVVNNIQVQWPSGIVQNLTNEAANRFITITEDGAGPVIASRTPAHAATDVPLAATFSITLDESATAVAGKKLNVFLASNQSAPAFSLDVASAAKNNNTYSFTLPGAQTLLPNSDYVITIDAGAFKDQFGNEFVAVSAGSWTFKTIDPPDATAPMITFTPAPTLAKGFGSASPSITVTDNKQVSAVTLSIRTITGSTFSNVSATAGSASNTWTATLSEANHFDAIGAEFFITATDGAGNTARSPEGTATHKVFLIYNENESKIPSDRLGFGGQKANWKVFAIPFELGINNAVTSVFNEFEGLTNKVDYRLITYGSETAWSEYPTGFTTVARGAGYFINIKEPVEIKIGNNLTAPQNSRASLFQINLKQGWNMVGNPYLTAISWADVAAYNSLTGTTAQLKKFANGQYSNNQSLSSYEGGFVFASAATTVSIPFLGQTTAGGRDGFRNLDTNIDAEGWALPLTLIQGELKYELGSLGMAPDASTSFDAHDDITPPRFFDYLEVNFSHPEHFAKRFTRDVVPTQSTYTWAFTADASLPGLAQLAWDDIALSGAHNDIFLLDVARQKVVNMKETGSYTFDPKESANFRVYFGSKLNLAPESVHLGKAYPNPTSGLTTVVFSLPESGGLTQQVSLDIMDSMGRAVGTISQGSYAPGYHEVSWDAKTLGNGFYTYRLTVSGEQGRTTQINKLIIK